MPDISIEEAVKANCQAVLAGDMMRVMGDLTPEALGKLMSNMGASGGAGMGPPPSGFEILGHEQSGDDHVFTVKFSGEQAATAVATWRDVGGLWKIADLAMEQA